ncbi:MAG: TetR/AcrR family transcriptional regulator [Pseudomonadales bacterium]|nr:TetR/AcrR family transcriptional regulator [Pseudomonadales bacterium]
MASTIRKSAYTRKQEIIAAARLLLMDLGHKAVKMDDIALQVGISKAAIFHHFENKKALFKVVVQSVAREPLAAGLAALDDKAGLKQNLINLFIATYSCSRYKSTPFMELVNTQPETYSAIIAEDTQTILSLLEDLLGKAEQDGIIELQQTQQSTRQFAELLLMSSYGVACPGAGPVLADADLHNNLSALMTALLHGIYTQKNREN